MANSVAFPAALIRCRRREVLVQHAVRRLLDPLRHVSFNFPHQPSDAFLPDRLALTSEAPGLPSIYSAGLESCHTALVAGYVLEGHVPATDIQRLLLEQPAVRGLAVPGMPIGSPGMELPGWAVLIARLIPIVSFDVISYAARLTRIRLVSFLAATIIGMALATFVYTYLGYRTPGHLPCLLLASAVVAMIVGIVVWRRYFRHRPSSPRGGRQSEPAPPRDWVG